MAVDRRIEWFRPQISHLLGLRTLGSSLTDDLLKTESALFAFKSFLDGGDAGSVDTPALLVYMDPPVYSDGNEQPERRSLASPPSLNLPPVPAPAPAPAEETPADTTPLQAALDAVPVDAEPAAPPLPAAPARTDVPALSSPKLHVCSGSLPRDQGRCPTAYFARDAAPPGPLELEDLSKHVACGLLASGTPSLSLLDQVVRQVYLPMLTEQALGKSGRLDSKGPSEMVASLERFSTHLDSMIHELQGDVKLAMPEVDLSDPEAAGRDMRLVTVLEDTLREWTEAIEDLLQRELSKEVQEPGATAEIRFWKQRNALVGGVHEQLGRSQAAAVVEVACTASEDAQLISAFRSSAATLKQVTEQARDNLKFLATLERHFEVLAGGSLAAITDCLPALMGALRMVWIISRYYGDDETMGSLFRRIANQIGDRIEAAIKPEALFKMPQKDAVQLLKSAQSLGKQWYNVYMQVREQIEAGGRDSRWEFNKASLFERTTHAATVCGDLEECVNSVHTFRTFLGPALRSITGDIQAIDDVVMMVDSLGAVVSGATVPLLSSGSSAAWTALKTEFSDLEAEVAAATQQLIDKSFRKLRSAEAALHLLVSIRIVDAGGPLQAQLLAKSTDIVAQFARELDAVSTLFRTRKGAPPIARDAPPVAGAIQWSRGLMARCQRTMHCMESMQTSLLDTPFGSMAKAQYRALAKGMLAFEKGRFEPWRSSIDPAVTLMLEASILTEDGQGRIAVNFSQNLRTAIQEARLLDRMGFEVPPATTSLALQEAHYFGLAESLASMLNNYYQAIEQLSPVEHDLLTTKLDELRRQLLPGFSPLNWAALGIPDFVATVNQAVGIFLALVVQVRKSANLAMAAKQAIAEASICPDLTSAEHEDSLASEEVPPLQGLADDIEQHHTQMMQELLKQYHSIPPCLITIEELVHGTATGKCPELAAFYVFWEVAVYRGINDMVLKGVNELLHAIGARHRDKNHRKDHHKDEAKPAKHRPLFKTSLQLIGGETVLVPTPAEVEKTLGKVARGLIECAKRFVRWMDGTCIVCPPIKVSEDDEDEPFVHSFFSDVSAFSSVVKAVLSLSQHGHRAMMAVTRYQEGWRRHNHLWKLDKGAVIAKLVSKNPSTTVWEARLAQYTRAANNFRDQSDHHDLAFVRVDATALANAAREEAVTWIHMLIHAMRREDLRHMKELQESLAQMQSELRQPSTEGAAIRTVQAQTAAMDVRVAENRERCRVRKEYGEAAAGHEITLRRAATLASEGISTTPLNELIKEFQEAQAMASTWQTILTRSTKGS